MPTRRYAHAPTGMHTAHEYLAVPTLCVLMPTGAKTVPTQCLCYAHGCEHCVGLHPACVVLTWRPLQLLSAGPHTLAPISWRHAVSALGAAMLISPLPAHLADQHQVPTLFFPTEGVRVVRRATPTAPADHVIVGFDCFAVVKHVELAAEQSCNGMPTQHRRMRPCVRPAHSDVS
jgi:hypothetical protein